MTTAIEMPSYIGLLKGIGIPGIIEARSGTTDPELARIAKLNKIALLYAFKADSGNDHEALLRRHQLLFKTLEEVCSLFDNHAIRYCVFKTVKPFPTTPSDVDILLSNEDFVRAEKLLMSLGYDRTARDAYSSTLEKQMIVDLQLQPSVSNVPYLPKALLMKNAVVKRINGFDVRTLNPEAELIVIAAHSIYKEQMLTMNDYYAITMLAEEADHSLVLSLSESANAVEVVRLAVGLCSQITKSVFNSDLKISHLSRLLGPSADWRIQSMPIRFPFSMIVRLLINRARKDKEMRTRVLPAALRFASPRQLVKLFSHIVRSTY